MIVATALGTVLTFRTMGRAADQPTVRATIVAYYGDKTAEFRGYLDSLQRLVLSMTDAFEPYELAQVHATLVGLEGYTVRRSFVMNANFLRARGRVRLVRSARLLDTLRAFVRRPLQIRIGGFVKGAAYPFLSRRHHPHERSFSLQGARVVAMGWTRVNDAFPSTLAQLRRELEPSGVLHKYHSALDADDDNDLYFVLGTMTATAAREPTLLPLLNAARRFMAEHPLDVALYSQDVQLVTYQEPSLRRGSSVAHRIEALDPSALEQILRDQVTVARTS